MSSTLNNIKIQLRTDDLSNWNTVNPVLKNGEIAIVVEDDGTENMKVGNGLSTFSQLGFFHSKKFKTDNIIAKSISQGYNNRATPTSLATGIFAEADGNFDVVHGIEAKAKEGDDYAFVFNGTNLPGIDQRYQSHGEGTFNVNPLSGLNGFYIGEENLSAIFNNYFLSSEISNYYNKQQINGIYIDLENKIISVDNKLSDYYKKSETSSSSELSTEFQKYLMSSDYDNTRTYAPGLSSYVNGALEYYVGELEVGGHWTVYYQDGRVWTYLYDGFKTDHYMWQHAGRSQLLFYYPSSGKIWVGVWVEGTQPTGKNPLNGDALNNFYYGTTYYVFTKQSKQFPYVPTDHLVISSQLSDYYKKSETYNKSETSSNSELNAKFTSVQTEIDLKSTTKIGEYGKDLSALKELSVVKILPEDYYRMVSEEKTDPTVLYILSSDHVNAHGQTIIEVAEPVLSNEAATKNYVDVVSSNIAYNIPTKTSQIQNDSGFLTAHQSLSEYYKKSETSSNVQLNSLQTTIDIQKRSKEDLSTYSRQILDTWTGVPPLPDGWRIYWDEYFSFEPCWVIEDPQYGIRGDNHSPSNAEVLTFNVEGWSGTAYRDKGDLIADGGTLAKKSDVLNLSVDAFTEINVLSSKTTASLENKRNLIDLSTYQERLTEEWTCEPPLPTGWTIERDSVMFGDAWVPFNNGSPEGSPQGDSSSTRLTWGTYDWGGGYEFTAIRKTVLSVDGGEIATKKYVDNAVSSIDLSEYYKKTETSSSVQLQSKFNEVQTQLNSKSVIKVGNHGEEVSSKSELSIINILPEDYYRIVSEEKLNEEVLYVVSSDQLNAFDMTITDVAEPVLSNDAATKNYVDDKFSRIDFSNYYTKQETRQTISVIVDNYLSGIESMLANI